MNDLVKEIRIEDYDYDLPEERIAQYPVEDRDKSKLLLYNNGSISKDVFRNLDKYLPGNSLLVINNTRVIRARILFQKETGANIEVFCLEPSLPKDYQDSFSSMDPVEWKCIIGNLKKWKKENLKVIFHFKGREFELSAEKLKSTGDAWIIRFSWSPRDIICFGDVLESTGHIPLPPYVKREDEKEDNIRYQTVYSSFKGSVAAPTAGLHFTKKVLDKIQNKGIESAELTLHVGTGTFQPVKSDDIFRHEMHSENFFVTRKVIEMLLRYQSKIIAVGTTSVRTLESLYWMGVKVIRNRLEADPDFFIGQWEAHLQGDEITLNDSLEALLGFIQKRNVTFLQGTTKIMIIPGYKFRVINGMITNFHQPRSTLLLLISAWVGNDWKKIYNYALENNFRFLSFGDCSLLLK